MYYIDTLKQDLSTANAYDHNRLDKTSVVDKHRCHLAAKFGVFADGDHIGFINFINDPISRVLLLILVHVLCNDIKPVRKEEGKFYWTIPLGDDDATREK